MPTHKLSRAALLAASPDRNVARVIEALVANSNRALLQAASIAALTDSSTGTPGASLVAVVTPPTKGIASGSNLAPRAAFNTAIGVVNNAITVLAKYLNDNVHTPLAEVAITLGNGTVATPGTIPTMTKALTATDGSSSSGMLRSEAVAQLTIARNNLATVVAAYNRIASTTGQAYLTDATGGKADTVTFKLSNQGTATTVVASTAGQDLALDTEVDAALLQLANNVATVASKLSTSLLASGSLSARVTIGLRQ
jgi:hypothetical protein